ncbi:MAG: ABC transporter permease [Anaerolineae bacterium]
MNRPVWVIMLWFGIILLAPVLSTHDPRQTNPANILQAPNAEYIFGTDALGRDIYSRTLHGGQRTLIITLGAAMIAIIPALLLAMFTLLHPIIQQVTTVLLNALLAFPSLLGALVILTLLGRGAVPIAIATGIAQAPFYLQVSRDILYQQSARPHILAARSLGASEWHIIRHHILPNATQSLAAYAGVIIAYCIINSAALSLLGLGGDPSLPDWGVMLATGRTAFRSAPWAALAPALAITITLTLINRASHQA